MTKMVLVSFLALLLNALPANAQQFAIPKTSAKDFKYFPSAASSFEIGSAQGGEKFAIIDVKKVQEDAWKVLIHSPTNKVPIKKDDQIVLTATVNVFGERTDEGNLGLYGENVGDTEKVFLGDTIYPTSKLRTYRKHYTAPRDIAVGDFRMSLHMGAKLQTLELHDISTEVYPPDFDIKKIKQDKLNWSGRAFDADWRIEALHRIEKLRKQNVGIVVRDADNKAISGATVTIKQKRHKFLFGVYPGREMLKDSVNGENYRRILKENYNLITVPAYLADWGWRDESVRKQYFEIADWAKANDFYTRGHLLVYPGWAVTPSEWFKIPKPELLKKLNAHIPRATRAFASRGVQDWDVANELRYNEEFMEEIGGIEVAADWFKLAREVNSKGKLFLSETSILTNRGETETEQAAFERHHKILVDAGAPIDGICLQGHFSTGMTAPVRLLEIIDRMTKMGDLMVTEFDLDNSEKNSQADYLRDFYTVCFSHPKVLGVNQWGFWEADMWKPRGHLIDKNWNETASFKAYRNLVRKAWWTDEEGSTDDNGLFETRAFKGIQTVAVTHDGYTWTGEVELGDEELKLDVVVP